MRSVPRKGGAISTDNPLASLRKFGSEGSCIEHLAALRWLGGPVCQKCGRKGRVNFVASRQVFWCGDCEKQFSVRLGTLFEDSRLPLVKWFAAIDLATSRKDGIGSVELAEAIGVVRKTASSMLSRMREARSTVDDGGPPSDGTLRIPLSFDDALTAFAGGARPGAWAKAELLHGDCRRVMADLPDRSVHMVLTDPPYFLDGLDGDWRKGGADAARATGAVGGLPVGMKFDPRQGVALQAFVQECANHWMRLLLPGGFALVFSQPRLAHRIAIGLEDAGFEIRDQIAWRFTQRAQFKAFTQDHFVDRMDLPPERKRELKRSMDGRRTPQLRPQFEAVILAQKPREGTFVANWRAHEVGLMDARSTLDSRVPSNVMLCEKPSSGERGATDGHLTPKPVKLLEHLIELYTLPGQTVLDCFLGSGSTAVAATALHRNCLGIEINAEYIEIARQRLGDHQ